MQRPASRSATKRALGLVERLESRAVLSALAISGDWDGDGTTTVGFYDPAAGTFVIRNENTPGFPTAGAQYGPMNSTLLPITGDWDGDGRDSIGLYDQASGFAFLKNEITAGAADIVFSFGPAGNDWLPVTGDWDNNGVDTLGLFVPSFGAVFLKNSFTGGAADVSYSFGPPGSGWQPIAGDWNGDGTDTIGLYDNSSATAFLRNVNANGPADVMFNYGPPGNSWTALAGDWNGDSVSSVGLYSTLGEFFLRDSQTPGPADHRFYVVATGTIGATIAAADETLSTTDVETLLARGAAASASNDAIIAVVDRGGRILGVRTESGIATGNLDYLVFAVDGAVAKARTAAFFANNSAPLTSRTIRFISQSTITQREVESNPNSADPLVRGPGFVAPIGVGGHFPPDIPNTPLVDLFGIEHTNRDATVHPGDDLTKGTADDILLPGRFNVLPSFVAPGQEISPPDSYGFASGFRPDAQSRGIATLPGGVPIYKHGQVVGGIGVFFPGPDGYATFEQGFVPGVNQTTLARTNASRVLESEWIAFAAAGGSSAGGALIGALNDAPALPANADGTPMFNIPLGRIDLVGIKLEIFGPHPNGLNTVLDVGAAVGRGLAAGGMNQQVTSGGATSLAGQAVPQGWLTLPHDSPLGQITAADVEQMVAQGVAQANLVRAAIRAPAGLRTRMAFAVTDTDGNVLGLFRMPDATVFSLDVAVAKARNTAYYADPAALQPIDQVDDNRDGVADLPAGVAFTNRTIRFLAAPRFPSGAPDGTLAGDFSILRDPGTNRLTAENTGAPQPITAFTSVLGFDAFHPGSNFRDPSNRANQNGIVFFPGSTPLYSSTTLIGGLGVSGDGVDQDDVVTSFAAIGYLPPNAVLQADEAFVRNVRLPYFKSLRNPEG